MGVHSRMQRCPALLALPGGQRDSFFEPKTCMCFQQLWQQLNMFAVGVVSGNRGSSVAGEQCPHISVFFLGREPCRHWAGMCHFRLFLLTRLSHRALLPCESLLLHHDASHRTTRRSSISSFTSHLTQVPSACYDWGKKSQFLPWCLKSCILLHPCIYQHSSTFQFIPGVQDRWSLWRGFLLQRVNPFSQWFLLTSHSKEVFVSKFQVT